MLIYQRVNSPQIYPKIRMLRTSGAQKFEHSFLIFAISSPFQWLPGYPLQQAAQLRTLRFSSNGDRPLNAGWSSTNPVARPSAASQFALSEASVFCGILSDLEFSGKTQQINNRSLYGD